MARNDRNLAELDVRSGMIMNAVLEKKNDAPYLDQYLVSFKIYNILHVLLYIVVFTIEGSELQ